MHLLGFWLHSGSGSVLNNANPLNALNAAGALRANSLFLFFFSLYSKIENRAHGTFLFSQFSTLSLSLFLEALLPAVHLG